MATDEPGQRAESPLNGAVQAMELRVWLDADGAWCATLVLPDAQVLQFGSPFALARHLSRLLPASRPGASDDTAELGGTGLR